jgi:phosphoglycolate phosphatase
MIRCVVFDFDGTLVHSNEIKRSAFFEVAGDFPGGGAVMERILRCAEGRDRYWVFARFADAMPEAPPAAELAQRYTKICRERIVQVPEVTGASANLDLLRSDGLRLFLSSATPRAPLLDIVGLRRMGRHFEAVYGAPESKLANLQAIRSRVECAPEEMVVVGDGESDRSSAQGLGCHFVAVQSDGNDFIAEPRHRVSDLTGLRFLVSHLT